MWLEHWWLDFMEFIAYNHNSGMFKNFDDFNYNMEKLQLLLTKYWN
jgi:hypothetical protein